jgi:hypothetical protein
MAGIPSGTEAARPLRRPLFDLSSRRTFSRKAAGTGATLSLAAREAGEAKAVGEMTGIAPSSVWWMDLG